MAVGSKWNLIFQNILIRDFRTVIVQNVVRNLWKKLD